jgi:8-oxo-dGTP pyrophosphatase MutT (NUDIX family)
MASVVIDESWYQFTPGLPERISAGGIIARLADDTVYVALAREGDLPNYVLPKGGLEAGETPEQAAIREIEEEAGLTRLHLLDSMGMLERLAYNKRVWLKTHMFLYATEQVEGTPTDHHNHHGVWWFPIDELPTIFWPDQKALIEANRDKITQLIRKWSNPA